VLEIEITLIQSTNCVEGNIISQHLVVSS
jgi:hypothetical protein